MSVIQRVRGILGTALLWGVAWAAIGLLFGTVVLLTRGSGIIPGSGLRFVALQGLFWAIWGSLSGVVFGSLLMLAERRATISTLSTWRVAAWGALGGFFLPVLTYGILLISRGGPAVGALVPTGIVAAIASLVGAGLAAGHLSLARQAPVSAEERRALPGRGT